LKKLRNKKESNMANYNPIKCKSIRPLHDTIIVSDMKFEERISTGGIVLVNDDMKNSGIRPRWGKIYALGPEVKDLQVGQYIMVSHGRWTRGIKIEDENGEVIVRKVDPKDILLVSDELVQDATMSDKDI
jgi:co-chaperonin GroES (HSP10)